jgi:hypothetical protein
LADRNLKRHIKIIHRYKNLNNFIFKHTRYFGIMI